MLRLKLVEFTKPTGDALRRVKAIESTILVEDFNKHVGKNVGVCKRVICQHGDANLNDNGKLLQLCCNNALCIMNTCFQQRDLHNYICCKDSFGVGH